MLEKYDFSLKRKCQALGNLYNETKDIRHVEHSKTRLFGIYLTLLQEKLMALMSF